MVGENDVLMDDCHSLLAQYVMHVLSNGVVAESLKERCGFWLDVLQDDWKSI